MHPSIYSSGMITPPIVFTSAMYLMSLIIFSEAPNILKMVSNTIAMIIKLSKSYNM